MYRVAYAAHTGDLSGPNNSLIELLAGLDRMRFEPVVYFPSPGPAVEEIRLRAVSCRVIPAHPIQRVRGFRRCPLYLNDLLQCTRALREALGLDRVDLVHINTAVTPYPALAAWSRRLPIVWHIRESLQPNLVNNGYLLGINFLATHLIAVSNAVRGQLITQAHVPRRKVSVVHNGIDLGRFDSAVKPCRTRAELGLPEGRLIAVTAFLLPHKGHEVFLEAMNQLVHAWGIVDVVAVLIGDEPSAGGGRFTRTLQEYCSRHQLTRNVHFLGLRRDVPAVLAHADIVCLPSTYPDPLPRAVLEGMAAGKPVVASATGGIPEMVEDRRTGILIPPSHPGVLAHSLATLLRDPTKSQEMGRAGRQRVESEFTAKAHAQKVQGLYERLLQSTDTKAGSFDNQDPEYDSRCRGDSNEAAALHRNT